MKRLLLLIFPFLPGCETLPVTVSYTGTAAGQVFTAAYSKASGAVLVVHQK